MVAIWYQADYLLRKRVHLQSHISSQNPTIYLSIDILSPELPLDSKGKEKNNSDTSERMANIKWLVVSSKIKEKRKKHRSNS